MGGLEVRPPCDAAAAACGSNRVAAGVSDDGKADCEGGGRQCARPPCDAAAAGASWQLSGLASATMAAGSARSADDVGERRGAAVGAGAAVCPSGGR